MLIVMRSTFSLLLAALLLLPTTKALAGDPGDPSPDIRSIQKELRSLKAEVQDLRGELKVLRSENTELRNQNTEIRQNSTQLQQQTAEHLKTTNEEVEALNKKVEAGASPRVLRGFLDDYWGEHRFLLTGFGTATFEYDRNTATNTFAAGLSPIFLFRLSDRISFESELEVGLPSEEETEIGLEYAQADIVINDHMQLAVGKTLLPFGDFIENFHPSWINRFVSNPLPYREEVGLMPFSTTGIQLRGGFDWGAEGQDLDYSLIFSNTPAFEQPTLVGSAFATNNIKTNTNGIAYGGRVRVYPIPLDADFGRLELGASTFNGKWLNGLWFTSWGVDAGYHVGPLELQGEYLETQRRMPAPASNDNRQGWYVQAGYNLYNWHVNPDVDNILSRIELLARYSGQNQRAVVMDPDEPIAPGNGMDVSPSLMSPHAREIALGLDYWILPSVVWKLEFDFEMPNRGGFLLAPDGTSMPATASNDRALMTQLAVGF